MKKAEPVIHEVEKLASEAKGPLEKEAKKVDALAKKAENEIDPSKKPESKQEDESLKLLGALWPVKKRAAGPKSMTTGPVYMEGTSNYGPSPTAEEDLLAPENLLHLDRDPTQSSKRSLEKPLPPPFKISLSLEETRASPLFWVQLGAFESLKAAHEAALYFRRRGYDADTFNPQDPLDPSPLYFVRLQLPVTEQEGLRRIHLFKMREKISASLVPYEPSSLKIATQQNSK